MSTRKVAPATEDPTIEKVPVKIGKQTYYLVFDLESLAAAESHFRQQGVEVNLLAALPGSSLSQVRTLFPCALHRCHPEISFADAQAMITMPVLYVVAAAIGAAWQASLPEPEADPTQAVAAE
jgi:hypothetical protein